MIVLNRIILLRGRILRGSKDFGVYEVDEMKSIVKIKISVGLKFEKIKEVYFWIVLEDIFGGW